MPLFEKKIADQLTAILQQMQNQVKLIFFSQEIECFTCRDARRFIEEIKSFNDKILLEKYNLVTDKEKAEQYKIDKVPAIVFLDKDDQDTGIRFFGIPGGYEINSFLSAIIEVSGKNEPLPAGIMQRIKKIDKPVHIQVFITLACPYCPGAVAAAHRLALENSHIRADMVDTNTFTPMAIRYSVSSVPKTVVNDKYELLGAQPLDALLDLIEKNIL